jgi:hypothetical protein
VNMRYYGVYRGVVDPWIRGLKRDTICPNVSVQIGDDPCMVVLTVALVVWT